VTGVPDPPRLIALIGFMGSGKSTVGRELADRMGWDFADLDSLIEEREGARVAEIFASRGETAFRLLESRYLAGLAGRERLVVAAGGGTPVSAANREFFTRAATFFLSVSLPVALERTGADPSRPLLARGLAALRELYDSRLPVYRSLGMEIDTDPLTPAEVAVRIMAVLGVTRRDQAPR
jgi:shikimate kinase